MPGIDGSGMSCPEVAQSYLEADPYLSSTSYPKVI